MHTPRDSQEGFTLIELLVVIAIIGILSATVLVSLNTARTKGADVAIKQQVVQMKRQAELYVDANGSSYTNLCLDVTVNGTRSIFPLASDLANKIGVQYIPATNGNNQTGVMTQIVCHSTTDKWAIQAPLKSGSVTSPAYFCTDSEGLAVTTSGAAANKLAGTGSDFSCL